MVLYICVVSPDNVFLHFREQSVPQSVLPARVRWQVKFWESQGFSSKQLPEDGIVGQEDYEAIGVPLGVAHRAPGVPSGVP